MKHRSPRMLLAALALVVSGCAAGYPDTGVQASPGDYSRSLRAPRGEVGVSHFYASLSPYGRWFQFAGQGWCWTPYDMSADWRPYGDGHWEFTDYGWYWVSNESWGWAPYHYGRWFLDDTYGWVWVPGAEWAPAWVAWRYTDEWCGWAPLPPSAQWGVSAGANFGDVNNISPQQWCFVPARHLLDANVRMQITSVARNATLVHRTRDMTRFDVRDGRPVNVGLDVSVVENVVGHRVRRVRVADVDAPSRGPGGHLDASSIGVYRPRVRDVASGERDRPDIESRVTVVPQPELQRQQQLEQRKLESALASERARLAREHEQEMRQPRAGEARADLQRRHDDENKAFEEHASQQRQVLQERLKRQIVKPDRARNQEREDKDKRNKGRGRGQSGGGE